MRFLLAATIMSAAVILAQVAWGAPTKPAPGEVVPWQAIFQAVDGARWIDRAAQVQAESRFELTAHSPTGALGPAQFEPATWKEWAKPPTASPQDPNAFIPTQNRYMNWIEARTKGLDPALGAYNAGLGSVLRAQRLAASMGLPGAAAWLQALPRITGTANAAQTRSYLVHNAENRTTIQGRAKR
jgi:membrane-bound lytic murein transglycosylase MltF